MICSNCGLEIGDARFCPTCGAGLPAAGATMSTMSPVAIREIAGRYRLFEKLGEGAMGAVYRGEQISLKRAVAVKLLKPELSADRQLVRRFISEAEAIAKLGHPNTVNIYDFGQDGDGSLFIVMEYIDGPSLRAVVQKEAPFTPTRALVIAAQIAASLADAHSRSIVHRDLKPDNVMLQTRGRQRDIVRVLDFGIAKLRDDNRATRAALTQAVDLLGTPQYMAPEQVVGDAIDGRTDIYALGCMIYEMVTQRRPFDATTVTEMLTKHLNETVVPPTTRRPDLQIPTEIDRLVLMAMMKQPVARPATMELFGEQIAAVLVTLPPDPDRISSELIPRARSSSSAPLALPPVGILPTPPRGSQPVAPAMATPLPPAGPVPTPPPGGYIVGRVTPMPGASGTPMPGASVTPMPGASQAYAPVSRSNVALAPAKSRDALYIVLGVIAIALIGGGVWIFGLRTQAPTPRPQVAGRDRVPAPTTPSAAPAAHDPTLPAQPVPAQPAQPAQPSGHEAPPPLAHHVPLPAVPVDAGAADHPSSEPAPPADRPAGDIVDAVQGVKLIVPPGFKVQRQKGNVVAQSPGYTIVVGPITSKLRDPGAAAREYAQATGLTLDGVVPVDLGGVKRSGAAFHGTLYGDEVAQSIISYTSSKYRVAVSLTMPYAARNDPTVRAFADELFARRVIVP